VRGIISDQSDHRDDPGYDNPSAEIRAGIAVTGSFDVGVILHWSRS
jgi:hypothetical protein